MKVPKSKLEAMNNDQNIGTPIVNSSLNSVVFIKQIIEYREEKTGIAKMLSFELRKKCFLFLAFPGHSLVLATCPVR